MEDIVMGWGKVVKAGLAVATDEGKKQGKVILGDLLTKLGNKLSDNNSLRADIDELQSKVCELAEHYDTELAKSRRRLALVSILSGVGIVAAIVLAIVV